MEKATAEQEKMRHANLLKKVIVHKSYGKKMQVVEMGIAPANPRSQDFYVYCKLKGDLGEVLESLDYVMSNYAVQKTS